MTLASLATAAIVVAGVVVVNIVAGVVVNNVTVDVARDTGNDTFVALVDTESFPS